MVFDEDPVANYSPWHAVERSRRDPDLDQYQGVKEEYLAKARCCPKCETPPEQLRWVYVREEPKTSELPRPHRCRQGDLLICDSCLL